MDVALRRLSRSLGVRSRFEADLQRLTGIDGEARFLDFSRIALPSSSESYCPVLMTGMPMLTGPVRAESSVCRSSAASFVWAA
ncbi:hypothetical protein ED92_26870 [Amycolatopsis sp. MJM2582]|uniref:hypothetical protein n=1 Tax=Amycolatopsis sp. MJM2582 TaxID=1427749 RepID=UPI000500C4A0|nr:hypothetical protein [Amycolatopsis sp. MJM2582]KFZ79212.1 hypothetical protein ED92_26870 [Amycolatopsis sp. MJM2582]